MNNLSKIKLYVQEGMGGFDSVTVSHKNGTIKFKSSYFYTHGQDSDSFAKKMLNQMNEAGYNMEVIDHSNHFNKWPKDSWFECILKQKS